jgi:molybdate transport system regulatory protein
MSSSPVKIRISHGKLTAMGPGKADLLDAIAESGSISAAAKQMHMSYRRAWELVSAMNQCFIDPLVVSSAGGIHGGGAHLTSLGTHILMCFRSIEKKTQEAARDELRQITSRLKNISE